MADIKIGMTSSVNKAKRTARVYFPDIDITSDELKVLIHQPFITLWQKVDKEDWNSESNYATIDRESDVPGVTYDKELPDKIICDKLIDGKLHEKEITIEAWLPFIGQQVVCIFTDAGDGFVAGGFA